MAPEENPQILDVLRLTPSRHIVMGRLGYSSWQTSPTRRELFGPPVEDPWPEDNMPKNNDIQEVD